MVDGGRALGARVAFAAGFSAICSVGYMAGALVFFHWGSTKRNDYDPTDILDPKKGGSVAKMMWETFNVERTSFVAPEYAANGHQLAAKGLEEVVWFYHVCGILLVIASLASFTIAIAIREYYQPRGAARLLQKSSSFEPLGRDEVVSPSTLISEFAISALLYASLSASLILAIFTLYSWSIAEVSKGAFGTNTVWASGAFGGFGEFLRCWHSVLVPFEKEHDDEYAALGVEDGCTKGKNYWVGALGVNKGYAGIGPLAYAEPDSVGDYAGPFPNPSILNSPILRLWFTYATHLGEVPRSPASGVYACLATLIKFGGFGAAPLIIFPCLFPYAIFTVGCVVPQTCLLMYSYHIVELVYYAGALHIFKVDEIFDFEYRFMLFDKNGYLFDEDYFYWDVVMYFILAVVASTSVTLESFLAGRGDVAGISGLVALVVPPMIYFCVWMWKDILWGGSFETGMLWFKFDTLEQLFILRLVIVFACMIGMQYAGKKATEFLPVGSNRYVLPMYFLCIWGCIGRTMQSTLPSWWMTLLLEMFLFLPGEVYQVWAYMHLCGPTAYTLKFIKGRGKVELPYEARSCVYRTLEDVPPKVYAYNSMIAVHAVTEAIIVLIGGLVPVVLNMNMVDSCGDDSADPVECSIWTTPMPYGSMMTNTFIALFFETLVADSIFCILAVRLGSAHTFLATWRMRKRGAVAIFVLTALVVSFPVFDFMAANAVTVADDHMFGVRLFPLVLQCFAVLRAEGCINGFGVLKQPLPQNCIDRWQEKKFLPEGARAQPAGQIESTEEGDGKSNAFGILYPSESWCMETFAGYK